MLSSIYEFVKHELLSFICGFFWNFPILQIEGYFLVTIGIIIFY